ncbi:MAG: hypothetical protein NTX64_00610 [Elusimicrobia bacterium]|nr:hypothetical protein [Elusimicrobiota bacterium]
MTAEESIRSIAGAKAAIDNGFSRVGRRLAEGDAAARWLHAGAGRAVALCDAIVLLCRGQHGPEAAAPARAAIQLAADLCWLARGPRRERLAELERDARSGDWGAVWSQSRLHERLKAAGWTEQELEERLGDAARLCAAMSAGGGELLPWAHAFSVPPEPRVAAEEVLAAGARALRDIAQALGARWPGCFAL